MRRNCCFVEGSFRSLLSGLLSLALVFSGVPATAWAEESGNGEAAIVAEDNSVEDESSDGQEEPVEGEAIEEEPTEEDSVDGEPIKEAEPEDADGMEPPEGGEPEASTESADTMLTVQSDDTVASGTWGTCPWEIDALGTLTIRPGKGADTSGKSPWADYSAIVKSVLFVESNGRKVVAPKDCSSLFASFYYVKSIDASSLDTSQVTNMNKLFFGCNALSSLDTSGWQVMYVTNMANMFTSCNKLKTVDVSNWNVGNVIQIGYMFSYCYALSNVDVSAWNTSKVSDMKGLFYLCRSLKQVDVSSFDTKNDSGNAIHTDKMFYGCTALESIDLSSWGEDYYDGGTGYKHTEMFVDCTSLKSFTVGGVFPFRNKTDIPVPTSSNGMWWSRKAKQWFTVEQILESRKTIADTYLNYEGIGFDVDVAQAKIVIQNQTYNGTERKPVPAVVLNNKTLVNGIDYTVSYADNINAGTAYVIITGRGNYAGEIAYPFTIAPKAITCRANSLTKEWGADDPELTATVSGLVCDDTISYSLLREPGEDVGEYVIAAEGAALQGNYKVTYSRAKLTVTKATVEVPTPVQLTYNGQKQQGVPAGNGYTLSGTVTATSAGSYTAKATPDANHRWPDGSTDTKSISWTIEQRSITEAIVGEISNQTFTGGAVTPQVTVSLGDLVLRSGIDYLLSFIDNIKVGTATATVMGAGNYTDTTTATFGIVPASIEDATITAPEPQTYTGKPLTPAVTVRFGDSTLTNGVDYTLEYANNTAVGTATITVTGKNSLEGSTEVTFAINRAIATVRATDQSKTYGTEDPDLQVQVSGIVDDYEISYTVSRDAGENVGTYAITPNGEIEQGNYLVTYEPGTLTIGKASLSTANVSVAGGVQVYTGSALTPRLVVTLDGKELKAGTDYTVAYGSNVNAGTGRATITGIGNYSGSKTVTFAIARASISTASASAADATYTGSAIKSDVTATWDGRTLVAGRDYTVSYEGNVNVGTATATLVGEGNFEGTVDTSFNISPASISDAAVAQLNDMTYTGKALTPEPTAAFNGTALRKGTDYSVAYANNTSIGTATVTLSGKGNFTGEASTTFKIVAASLADATVSADDAVYTGSACRPTVTVAWDGKKLKAGTDYTVAYGSNVNAGTGRVTVIGKGNYSGTNATTFSIAAAPLADATVSVSPTEYSGGETVPQVTVEWGGRTLKAGTDYTVSYADNVDVGVATATVTGQGNFTGSVTEAFNITAADIATAGVTDIPDQVYTGKAIRPVPTVKMNSRTLANGDDYWLSYSNNINVGTATVTITGKNNYAGSSSATFTIAPASIAEADISAISDQVYTGEALEPVPEVRLGDKLLAAETDYTVAYKDNIEVGTATLTVSGIGNYTGTASSTFVIAEPPKTDLSEATVEVKSLFTYDGSAKEPVLTVTLDDAELVAGTDYSVTYADNVNAGTATAILEGMGRYTGTKRVSFDISPASISEASIDLADQVYTGEELKPDLMVKLDSDVLVRGTDYTVTYENNINAGTALVTVSGKGNYAGTATRTFVIAPKSVTVAARAASKAYGAVDPALTGDVTGLVGSDTVEYDIAREAGEDVGTYAITASGNAVQGNYSVTYSGEIFTITPGDLSEASISIAEQTYSGEALKPAPKVTLDSTVLKAGTDYTVAYGSNINAGTVNVTITGKGNYVGTAKGAFTIKPARITGAKFTVEDQLWTGKAITPAVAVRLGTVTLKADTDYDIAFTNNVDVGTAWISVTGKGNYTGTVKGIFRINKLQNPFIDVTVETGHYDDILWLASQGISTGWDTPAGKEFRPYSNVVRADMAAFLFRLAKNWGLVDESWQPSGGASFIDVTPETPHYREVMWLAESGISRGWDVSGGKEFRPYASVVRADMAAFLYRLEALRERTNPVITMWNSPFHDVNWQTAHYNEVLWLASSGVSTGWSMPNGTREFRPYNDVVRADMAAFLHRLDGLR